MLAAVSAALAEGEAAVLEATLPLAETIQAIEQADAPVVIVIAGADLPAIERAMLLAAIGPLAVKLAPATRICALDVAKDAATEHVVAAARYLAAATSTTGQVLAIGG